MKMACGDPSAAFRIAHPRSRADRSARRAHVTAMAGYRRDRARRRDRGDDAPHAAVGHVLAAGLAPARRRRSSACCCTRPTSEARGDDAARRALRRHRHRAVDARRRARLRQSADRALRPRARPRARDPPSPRRPLERRLVASDRYAALLGSPRRRARDAEARRDAWRGASRTSPSPAACRPRLSDGGVEEEALPELAASRPRAMDRHVQPAAVRCRRGARDLSGGVLISVARQRLVASAT